MKLSYKTNSDDPSDDDVLTCTTAELDRAFDAWYENDEGKKYSGAVGDFLYYLEISNTPEFVNGDGTKTSRTSVIVDKPDGN